MKKNNQPQTLEAIFFNAITSICETFENGQSLEALLDELSNNIGVDEITCVSKKNSNFFLLQELDPANGCYSIETWPNTSFIKISVLKVDQVFGYILVKGNNLSHLLEENAFKSLQKFAFVLGQQLWLWNKIREKAISLEKAKDERNFFETILSNNPTEVVVINNDYKYVYLNKHAIKSDDLREWIVGKDDFEYCEYTQKNNQIAKNRRALLDQVKQNKAPYSFEETFDLGDGKYISHLRMLHPVLDEKQNLIYTIGYSINITKLKEQERLIGLQKEAITNAPDGIAILDPSGKYVFMNGAHELVFGYEKGELIGKPWEILYHEEEERRIKTDIFPLLMQDRIWRGETVGKKKNGELIYQDITLRMTEDNSLICATQDISSIKHNYALLKETNQKLELAIEANQLGMWSWNLATKKIEGNNHFFNVFFDKIYEQDEDPFESFLKNVHPDDKALVKESFGRLVQRSPDNLDPYQSIEFRILKGENEFTWIMSNARAINFDKNGLPQQIIGFILVTNEIKQAEHKIRESERKYKELVENLREVIFETDENLNFSFLNAAWKQVTGNLPEAYIGNSITKHFDDKVKKKIEAFVAAEKHSLEIGQLQIEAELKNKNGPSIWLDLAIGIKKGNEGQYCGTRGSMEDITLRKNAEIELRKALEKERELNELKGRFVNMVSHELRTPLAGIRSSAEIMGLRMDKSKTPIDETLAKAFKSKIEHIVQDVERITSLITDVLTMGQIDASRIKFSPTIGNLKDFIIRYMNVESPRIIGAHTLLFNDKTQEAMVSFDPIMIAHIMNNILGNAAKYSEANSEIKIVLSNQDSSFKIEVSDQGIGIPAADQGNIFTTFFRSSNVENIPGTGLGLSIVKYFTEMHQGSLALHSKEGEGTTITILIPLWK